MEEDTREHTETFFSPVTWSKPSEGSLSTARDEHDFPDQVSAQIYWLNEKRAIELLSSLLKVK